MLVAIIGSIAMAGRTRLSNWPGRQMSNSQLPSLRKERCWLRVRDSKSPTQGALMELGNRRLYCLSWYKGFGENSALRALPTAVWPGLTHSPEGNALRKQRDFRV